MTDQEKTKEKTGTESPAPISGRRYARRRGDIHGQEAASYSWLTTFTDVMGLMLTFFVLMFSMAKPEQQGFSDLMSSMQNEFNKFYGPKAERGVTESINISRINFDQALNIDYLSVLMETLISDNGNLKGVTINKLQGQLVLSLPEALLFDTGAAEVKPEGAKALYALGETLGRIKNQIQITGMADPRPVEGTEGGFGSNWELSLARAASVTGILANVGYDREIDIRGLSSGPYDDLLESIADEEQRLSLSRRADIVIMEHDGKIKKGPYD